MASWSAPPLPHRLCQRIRQLPLFCHQHTGQRLSLLHQDMDLKVGAVEQNPQISRRRSVVSQQQQSEQITQQCRVLTQLRLINGFQQQ